jgi:hypothetical protein
LGAYSNFSESLLVTMGKMVTGWKLENMQYFLLVFNSSLAHNEVSLCDVQVKAQVLGPQFSVHHGWLNGCKRNYV